MINKRISSINNIRHFDSDIVRNSNSYKHSQTPLQPLEKGQIPMERLLVRKMENTNGLR